jgi:hypothetical protein
VSVSVVAYREGLAEFLARFPWQYFVTLTWDPARRPRALSARHAERLARVAMCILAKLVAGRHWKALEPPTIQYAGVIEYSKAGDIHVHLVVILSRPLREEEVREFLSWWLKRFGFAWLVPVGDVAGLTSYLAKAAGPSEEFFVSVDLR